jgi:hypothetical protein
MAGERSLGGVLAEPAALFLAARGPGRALLSRLGPGRALRGRLGARRTLPVLGRVPRWGSVADPASEGAGSSTTPLGRLGRLGRMGRGDAAGHRVLPALVVGRTTPRGCGR